MKIELKSIKIADLINGYSNDPDTGVKGFGGKLDIRPPYQREFRYDVKQQQAVVDTILKGFPLNIMYWSVGEDGNYEMIDGQQRTLSICEFRTHGFNIEDLDRGTQVCRYDQWRQFAHNDESRCAQRFRYHQGGDVLYRGRQRDRPLSVRLYG